MQRDDAEENTQTIKTSILTVNPKI